MPRPLPSGLIDVQQNRRARRAGTLHLLVPDPGTGALHSYYLATSSLTINGIGYQNALKSVGPIKQSLTRAADHTTVEIQNVDKVFGVEILRLQDLLYGAQATPGRYWRDLDSGAEFHQGLLQGVVVGIDEIDEKTVKLNIVSEAHSTISVGASRAVTRECTWLTHGGFKGPQCGYTGPHATCNGLLNHSGGCQDRHGTPVKMAKYGGMTFIAGQAAISGAAALPPPPANQLIQLTDGTTTTSVPQRPFTAFQGEGISITDSPAQLATIVNLTGLSGGAGETINIVKYGAVGDDATDNTIAINAALATGKNIFIPAGTFRFSGTLILKKGQIIFGVGAQSVLKYTGTGIAMHEPDGVITGPTYSRIRLADFELTCTSTATIGVELVHNYEVSFQNFRINGNGTGFTTAGVHIKATNALYNSAGISFSTNCKITLCAGDGIRVSGVSGVAGLWVKDCHIQGNGGWGIRVMVPNPPYPASSNVNIDGNLIEGNGLGQIYADVLRASTINGNHFEHVAGQQNKPHVRLGAIGFAQGFAITGNIFGTVTSAYAIDCTSAGDLVGEITGNDFIGYGTAAVFAQTATGLEVGPNNIPAGTTELAVGAAAKAVLHHSGTKLKLFGGASAVQPSFESTGDITSPLYYVGGRTVRDGAADPEGSVAATPGSLYLRDTGAVYRKATGTGNTGWTDLAPHPNAVNADSSTLHWAAIWTGTKQIGAGVMYRSPGTNTGVFIEHLLHLTHNTYNLGAPGAASFANVYAGTKFQAPFFEVSNGMGWYSGTFDPEGAVALPAGSLFSRTDGAIYRKASGTGVAGWQQLGRGHDVSHHGATLPYRPKINIPDIGGLQARDYGAGSNPRTELLTYGVPTGLKNVITDAGARGYWGASTGTIAADSRNQVTITSAPLSWDWKEGNGIWLAGRGAGGGPHVTKVIAVNDAGTLLTLETPCVSAGANTEIRHDDRAVFQALLDADFSKHIVMPPGTFVFQGELVLPPCFEGDSYTLQGAGAHSTQLIFQHGGSGLVAQAGGFYEGFVLKDFAIASLAPVPPPNGHDFPTGAPPNNYGHGIDLTGAQVVGWPIISGLRIIGFGRWGFVADNVQGGWFDKCIFRNNGSGSIALISDDTTFAGAQEPNACTFQEIQAELTPYLNMPGLTRNDGSMAAGSNLINCPGANFTPDIAGRVIRVVAGGVIGGDLVGLVKAVNSPTQLRVSFTNKLATALSNKTVIIEKVNIAAVYLMRAKHTNLQGLTIQGNFSNSPQKVHAVRMEWCGGTIFNSVWCENTGGSTGLDFDLSDCENTSVTGYRSNSSVSNPLTNDFPAGNFKMTRSWGLRVREMVAQNGSLHLDMDETSGGFDIDDSELSSPDFVNSTFVPQPERVVVGDGMRYYSERQMGASGMNRGTAHLYDAVFGENRLKNARYADGKSNWTDSQPTLWSIVSGSGDYGTYALVNTQGAAQANEAIIFEQHYLIPNDEPPLRYALGFNFRIENLGAVATPGQRVLVEVIGANGVGSYQSYAIESDNVRNLPVNKWLRQQITFDTGSYNGVNQRVLTLRVQATRGPNTPRVRFANWRLHPGRHVSGSHDQPLTEYAGGTLRSHVRMVGLTSAPAAPPAGSLNFYPKVVSGAVKLFQQTSAGVETEWGIGGGGSSIVINVKDAPYNAVGDGVADDTMAIQSAINASAAGGHAVYAPPGVYKTTAMITVPGGVIFYGAGVHRTRIRGTHNAPIIFATNGTGAHLYHGPTIERLTVEGINTDAAHVGLRPLQMGILVDSDPYMAFCRIFDVSIGSTGSHGLFIKRAFSSFFQYLFSSVAYGVGYPFVFDVAQMPGNRYEHLYPGDVNAAAPAGMRVLSGSLVAESFNGINATRPAGTQSWFAIIGRRTGLYEVGGYTAGSITVPAYTGNSSSAVIFHNSNFESNTKGGIKCLFNSRVSILGDSSFGGDGNAYDYIPIECEVLQQLPEQAPPRDDIFYPDFAPKALIADTVVFANGMHVDLTGTVTATVGSNNLIGTGTLFLSQLYNGQLIRVHGNDYRINTRTSDTALTITGTFGPGITNKVLQRFFYKEGQMVHANDMPLMTIENEGLKVAGDWARYNTYWDTTLNKRMPMHHSGANHTVTTVTGTTTFNRTGVSYIEAKFTADGTITLPWAGWQPGTITRPITIKNLSAAGINVTINAGGGSSIGGAGSQVLSTQGASIVLMPNQADGDYRIVASHGAASLPSTLMHAHASQSTDYMLKWTSNNTAGSGPIWTSGNSIFPLSHIYSFADNLHNIGGDGFNHFANIYAGTQFKGPKFTLNAGPSITGGSGDPEGNVPAEPGSVYLRTNGTWYQKASSSGNTGWAVSGLSGTGAANRIAYWSGASGLTSTAGYEVDTANGALKSDVRVWANHVAAAGAPAFSFTGRNNQGMYSAGANELGFAVGGGQKFGLGTSTSFIATDLTPESAGTRALGGSSLRWAHIYTDNVDVAGSVSSSGGYYELITGAGNTGLILSDTAPTSGVRARMQVANQSWLNFGTTSNHSISFLLNGATKWWMDTNGTLRPEGNGTQNFGADGQRIKDFYQTGFHDFGEISAPSTPASGKARLYNKAGTNNLYYKNAAGTEVDLSAGATAIARLNNLFGSTAGDDSYVWSNGRQIRGSSANELHFEVAADPYDPNPTWSRWSWTDTSAVNRNTSYQRGWLRTYVVAPAGNTGATLQWTNSTGVENCEVVLSSSGSDFNNTHDPFEVRLYGVQNPTSTDEYVGIMLRINTAWDIGSRFRLAITKGTGTSWTTPPTTIGTSYGLFSTTTPILFWLNIEGGYVYARSSGVDVPGEPATFDFLATALTSCKTARFRYHAVTGLGLTLFTDRIKMF